MNLFKFTPTGAATDLHLGEPIQGYDSVTWTERFQEPGDFKIEAKLSSGLGDLLVSGDIISHTDTLEIMIVESQEIQEDEDTEEPIITITGRSFETFLENRQVGVNRARQNTTIADYVIPANTIWQQCVFLINDHITGPYDSDDSLIDVTAVTSVPGTGTSVARTIDRGSVHERLLELLKAAGIGVRTLRRNDFGGLGSSTLTYISIYKGADLTSSVIFSWKARDLDSMRYLFSQKKLKNSALVVGRYVFTVVDTGGTNYDRRIMLVDANDIDGSLTAPPTGTALTNVLNAMAERGKLILAKQSRIHMTQADVASISQYQYRKDYNVGDLVTLDGNYGQTAQVRITEFAEIEDENGVSGHPTLELPEPL